MPFRQTNRTPTVLNKYEEVVRLRSLGHSFQVIAEQVGYAGRSGAREAYSQAIKMWGSEAVDELRVVENERLDHLQRTLMTQLETALHNSETSITEITTIINSAINLSKRRSSLNGLDSAKKHEVTGPDGAAVTTDIGQILKERLKVFEQQKELEGNNTPLNYN